MGTIGGSQGTRTIASVDKEGRIHEADAADRRMQHTQRGLAKIPIKQPRSRVLLGLQCIPSGAKFSCPVWCCCTEAQVKRLDQRREMTKERIRRASLLTKSPSSRRRGPRGAAERVRDTVTSGDAMSRRWLIGIDATHEGPAGSRLPFASRIGASGVAGSSASLRTGDDIGPSASASASEPAGLASPTAELTGIIERSAGTGIETVLDEDAASVESEASGVDLAWMPKQPPSPESDGAKDGSSEQDMTAGALMAFGAFTQAMTANTVRTRAERAAEETQKRRHAAAETAKSSIRSTHGVQVEEGGITRHFSLEEDIGDLARSDSIAHLLSKEDLTSSSGLARFQRTVQEGWMTVQKFCFDISIDCHDSSEVCARSPGRRFHWAHSLFDPIFSILIIANAIVISLGVWEPGLGPGEEPLLSSATIKALNEVFLWLFTFELLVRLIGLGFAFEDTWHIMDFVIIAATWLFVLGEDFLGLEQLRVVRVLRIVRTFKSVASLRIVFSTMIMSFKSILAVTLVLFTVIMFMSVVAVEAYWHVGIESLVSSVRILPPPTLAIPVGNVTDMMLADGAIQAVGGAAAAALATLAVVNDTLGASRRGVSAVMQGAGDAAALQAMRDLNAQQARTLEAGMGTEAAGVLARGILSRAAGLIGPLHFDRSSRTWSAASSINRSVVMTASALYTPQLVGTEPMPGALCSVRDRLERFGSSISPAWSLTGLTGAAQFCTGRACNCSFLDHLPFQPALLPGLDFVDAVATASNTSAPTTSADAANTSSVSTHVAVVLASVPFSQINFNNNFHTLMNSLMLLFRSTTGEDWPEVMTDVSSDASDSWSMADLFFLLFWILTTQVLLNLYLGAIMAHFESQFALEHGIVRYSDMLGLREAYEAELRAFHDDKDRASREREMDRQLQSHKRRVLRQKDRPPDRQPQDGHGSKGTHDEDEGGPRTEHDGRGEEERAGAGHGPDQDHSSSRDKARHGRLPVSRIRRVLESFCDLEKERVRMAAELKLRLKERLQKQPRGSSVGRGVRFQTDSSKDGTEGVDDAGVRSDESGRRPTTAPLSKSDGEHKNPKRTISSIVAHARHLADESTITATPVGITTSKTYRDKDLLASAVPTSASPSEGEGGEDESSGIRGWLGRLCSSAAAQLCRARDIKAKQVGRTMVANDSSLKKYLRLALQSKVFWPIFRLDLRDTTEEKVLARISETVEERRTDFMRLLTTEELTSSARSMLDLTLQLIGLGEEKAAHVSGLAAAFSAVMVPPRIGISGEGGSSVMGDSSLLDAFDSSKESGLLDSVATAADPERVTRIDDVDDERLDAHIKSAPDPSAPPVHHRWRLVSGKRAVRALKFFQADVRAQAHKLASLASDDDLEVSLGTLLEVLSKWAFGSSCLPEKERLLMELRLRRWRLMDSYALKVQRAYRRAIRRRLEHASDRIRSFLLKQWKTQRPKFRLVSASVFKFRLDMGVAAGKIQRAWKQRPARQPMLPADSPPSRVSPSLSQAVRAMQAAMEETADESPSKKDAVDAEDSLSDTSSDDDEGQDRVDLRPEIRSMPSFMLPTAE